MREKLFILTFFHRKSCATGAVSGYQQPDYGDSDRSLFKRVPVSENTIQRGKAYIFSGISQEQLFSLSFLL